MKTILGRLTTTNQDSFVDAINEVNTKASGAASSANLTSHTSNTTVHITASERTTWNAKAGTSVATTSANGLMAAADKVALNNATTHASNYLLHGVTGTTAGSANAYTLTPSPALSAYSTDLRVTLFVNVNNTGSSTLNISGLGAKTLKKNDGSVFASGDLKTATPYTFVYNGTDFLVDSIASGGEALVNYTNYATSSYTISDSSLTANTITERKELAGASVGDYALFAGGQTTDYDPSALVDAYNSSLVKSTATVLSKYRQALGSASIGNYALFAGGAIGGQYSNIVDAYDSSLVRSAPAVLTETKSYLASGSTSKYAWFAGGDGSDKYRYSVDVYDASLVKTAAPDLATRRMSPTAATVGNYIIFAGGLNTSTQHDIVEAYDSSLTKTSVAALSVARGRSAGASAGDYAIIAGGMEVSYSSRATVDAYDKSLTRTTIKSLPDASQGLSGLSHKGKAIFAGGKSGAELRNVNQYTESLVRLTLDNLATARMSMGAATVGDHAIFAGGYRGTVDAYKTVESASIPVTKGSKYKFTESAEQTADSNKTIRYESKVSGYVKIQSGTVQGG